AIPVLLEVRAGTPRLRADEQHAEDIGHAPAIIVVDRDVRLQRSGLGGGQPRMRPQPGRYALGVEPDTPDGVWQQQVILGPSVRRREAGAENGLQAGIQQYRMQPVLTGAERLV